MESSRRSIFSSPANWFTFLRLILAPILWFLSFKGKFTLVGYGLLLVILTDILDGQIARMLDQCTKFGARLDSIADHIIMISSVIWLIMARPDIISAKKGTCIAVLIVYLAAILIGFIKGGRFGGAHLLEGKVFGFFGYFFLIYSLLGYYSDFLFYAAMITWVIHSTGNILYFYRPDLYEPSYRSLILGLSGVKVESKVIGFLLDDSGQD